MERRTQIKRDRLVAKMHKAAVDLLKNYTWDKYQALWDMSLNWNREHEDCEIFMCETCDDDDNVNGFMIEDYPYYYA